MASSLAGFAKGQWVKGEVEGRGTLTYGVNLSRFEPEFQTLSDATQTTEYDGMMPGWSQAIRWTVEALGKKRSAVNPAMTD